MTQAKLAIADGRRCRICSRWTLERPHLADPFHSLPDRLCGNECHRNAEKGPTDCRVSGYKDMPGDGSGHNSGLTPGGVGREKRAIRYNESDAGEAMMLTWWERIFTVCHNVVWPPPLNFECVT